MRLTPKLLSFLPRFLQKDPDRFLALRLRYRWGAMKWTVSDAVLTTTVEGGSGQALSVDLTQYTLVELVDYLAAQPGYLVVYADNSERAQLSARVLLDGNGDQDASNGDHLYGYTSLLWAYLEAQAVELQEAKAQIDEAIAQMSTRTASGEWLDEWGSYYGVPRRPGEMDESYGPRIIAAILRPRGNNVAIEMAISEYTGQETRVRDVTQWSEGFRLHDGSIDYDGSETHDSSAVAQYGLFDVEYGYNLLSGTDFSEFADIVRGLVARLRDAGTHLRALALRGSAISDAFTPPTDGGITSLAGALALEDEFSEPSDDALSGQLAMAALSDSLEAPADEAGLDLDYSTLYDGGRSYNGDVPHASGGTVSESL